MMTKEEILTDLDSMSTLISTAREGLSRNELIDLEGLEARVRGIVESITDLEPEEAVDMRPLLVELLTDFKDFAEEVQSKLTMLQSAHPTNDAENTVETDETR